MRRSATRTGRKRAATLRPVLMFKILVIQATNNLSDERAEFLINDQSRSLAIRTMSRSIAVSASSANGRPQMRLPMRAVVCAKACSTRAIRRAGCGPIPPIESAANETFLNKNGFVSHIHRKKPKGRAMPETMRRANNANRKSARVSRGSKRCVRAS
jgi:hypothetical protein